MGKKILIVLLVILALGEKAGASERNLGNLQNVMVDFEEKEEIEEIRERIEVVAPREIRGRVRGVSLQDIEGRMKEPQDYMWPIEWKGATSEWGYRRDPITGKQRVKHSGVDLRAAVGTPVYAPAEGVVRVAGWMRGYGKTVILDHEGGYSTRFAHLNSYNVKKGDTVRMGDRIAATGNTGRSTGPHLHYEIRKDEVALNPMKYWNVRDEGVYTRKEVPEENIEVTLKDEEKKSVDI